MPDKEGVVKLMASLMKALQCNKNNKNSLIKSINFQVSSNFALTIVITTAATVDHNVLEIYW